MKRYKNVTPHPYVGGAYGAEIADSADEAPPQGSMLWPADRPTLDWAASHWPEVDPAHFLWDRGKRGREVHHIESGEVFRLQVGLPVWGTEQQSRVKFFCVRDGRLILLAEPPKYEPPIPRTAAYTGRRIDPGVVVPTDDDVAIY